MALSNSEKQKRWRQRHSAELRLRRAARLPRERQGPDGSPKHRVYELVDDEGLPRYVGVGDWHRLWENRERSGSKLAEWFRSLAAIGRKPSESRNWVPSLSVDGAFGRPRGLLFWRRHCEHANN